MQPLVSIIMGVYNEEDNLSKCIDSILSQRYINWEFIICDDCSTDNTRTLLSNYVMKDDRIKVITNSVNCRLAASLNNCLKIAKGKYIARMDADDESLPERLQVQVDYLENNPSIDCVGCAVMVFDEREDKGIRMYKEFPAKEDLLKTNPFAHPTIMIKRDVINSLGGYKVSEETRRAEDLDLWFRFYKAGYRGHNMRNVLYRYHESENDMRKRDFKAAIGISKVYLDGYRLLQFPRRQYIFAIKPIISSLVPNKLMSWYHNKKLNNYK